VISFSVLNSDSTYYWVDSYNNNLLWVPNSWKNSTSLNHPVPLETISDSNTHRFKGLLQIKNQHANSGIFATLHLQNPSIPEAPCMKGQVSNAPIKCSMDSMINPIPSCHSLWHIQPHNVHDRQNSSTLEPQTEVQHKNNKIQGSSSWSETFDEGGNMSTWMNFFKEKSNKNFQLLSPKPIRSSRAKLRHCYHPQNSYRYTIKRILQNTTESRR
jgi:hypothetical protein